VARGPQVTKLKGGAAYRAKRSAEKAKKQKQGKG
jgi:hypothetical protein